MKEIVILEETLDLLARKDDRADVFFVRDRATGDFRRVELIRALPEAAPEWHGLTKSDPVRIVHCRVLTPPCRQSIGEWEAGLDFAEPWEIEYCNRHRELLVLSSAGTPLPTDSNSAFVVHSEDDEPLVGRLVACKEDWRESFEQEKKALNHIEDEKERGKAKRQLYARYHAPFHFQFGAWRAGLLNLTLEQIKQGDGIQPDGRCIRDGYLIDYWAKRQGYDLQDMVRRRSEFFHDLKSHAGAIYQHPNKAGSGETFRPVSLRREDDPRFLSCAARVSFRCDFEDGSSAYLQEFKFSTPQLPEIQQLANLLEGARSRGFRETEHRPSKELSKKRAAAGHKAAKVQLPEDRKKIKAAFLVRVNGGLSNSAAAREVAALALEDENTLGLVDVPYCLSPDTIKRIAGARKNK